MMAVKMMEFTHKEDKQDIVKELLDYFNYSNAHLPSKLTSKWISKLKDLLDSEVANGQKGFISKFEYYENELKTQLFSTAIIKKSDEVKNSDSKITLPDSETSIPIITPPASYLSNIVDYQSRYSLWTRNALTLGLSTVVIGLAIAQREEIAEGVKTVCKIQ